MRIAVLVGPLPRHLGRRRPWLQAAGRASPDAGRIGSYRRAVQDLIKAAEFRHGHQAVRQPAEVRGGAQQPRHLGCFPTARGTGQHVHPPQARRRRLPQLRMPVLQPPDGQLRLRVVEPLRRTLRCVHPERQLLQLGAAGRLSQHQPAERPRPRGQQPILQARPDHPPRSGPQAFGGEQAVCHPGDPHPARQHPQRPGQAAGPGRLTTAARGNLQHHVPLTSRHGQAMPGRQHLHRAPRTVPDPREPDRPGAPVVRRAQRGGPLPRQHITMIITGPGRRLELGPAGDLRNPPGIQPARQLPGRRRHHTTRTPSGTEICPTVTVREARKERNDLTYS